MTAYAWFVRGEQHAGLAQVAMASIKKVDRAASFIVSTDDERLADIPGARMVRFKSNLPIMVANLEAQLMVLWEQRTPVWFLDTDLIVLKPLPPLWEEQIAVTWRANLGGKLKDATEGIELMPYNYGVVGAHPGRRVFEAFVWMRERIRRMSPQLQGWYGNQMALAALAGPAPAEGEVTELRRIPWRLDSPSPELRVRKIPGDVWNYTPAEAGEDLTGLGVLHFKGHARPLMEEYAAQLGLPWPKKEQAA